MAILVTSGKPYDRLRAWVTGKVSRYANHTASQVLIFLPDMAVFLSRMMVDPRTPLARRLMAGAAIGYLVSPIDMSPDWLPVIGLLDDLAIVALAIRELLQSASPEAVQENWPGDGEVLDAVNGSLDWIKNHVPQRTWRRWMAHRLF